MGSPCPSNLTGITVSAGTTIKDTEEFGVVRTSINNEFTRRSKATSSWMAFADPIDDAVWNEMRNDVYSKLGGVSPPGPPTPDATKPTNTVSTANVVLSTAGDTRGMNEMIAQIDLWKVACICDCDYCTCDCDYCACDCNYCTCNCDYCTCDCNYCTCNCDYCTCNCNYCTCACAWSK